MLSAYALDTTHKTYALAFIWPTYPGSGAGAAAPHEGAATQPATSTFK